MHSASLCKDHSAVLHSRPKSPLILSITIAPPWQSGRLSLRLPMHRYSPEKHCTDELANSAGHGERADCPSIPLDLLGYVGYHKHCD